MVTVAAGTRWVERPLGVRPTLPAARGSSQLAAIAESLTGTKIKNFFHCRINTETVLKISGQADR